MMNEWVATLFDNAERILYVLRNVTLSANSSTLECLSFYVQFISNDRLNFYELSTFRNVHPSNSDRLLWTEDPYSHRAVDRKLVIYAISCEEIMQTLLDGKPGTAVHMLDDVNLRRLSVSRGIAIIHILVDGNTEQQVIINLHKSSLMIACNMMKLPVQPNRSGNAAPFFADQLCALQKANCTVMNQSFIDKHYQVTVIASMI
ncbi:unnamed protein product [Litomosoides sigmodontis]|uniref:Uncharacterized protein n=1 Tax=Litomosoides sigmodontis TaxID=42156 RepID=A0A3P6V6H7_LITSI|nr:unnamed protein product [Litomosoides sigmodontis]